MSGIDKIYSKMKCWPFIAMKICELYIYTLWVKKYILLCSILLEVTGQHGYTDWPRIIYSFAH